MAARIAESVAEQRDGALTAPMVFRWDGPTRLRCAACADAPSERPPPATSRRA
jgi:hypothetical protein